MSFEEHFFHVVADATGRDRASLCSTTPLTEIGWLDDVHRSKVYGELERAFLSKFPSKRLGTCVTVGELLEVVRSCLTDTSAQAGRALTLYTHLSAIRATLVTSLLAASLGFSTYLLKYRSDTPQPTRIEWFSIGFVFSVQLAFFCAAAFSNLRLSNLRRSVAELILDLEEGQLRTHLFALIETARVSLRPRDAWDMLVVIGGLIVQIGLAIAVFVVQ